MAYPFQCNLKIGSDTSKKLKVLSLAGSIPITELCIQIVDYIYSISDKKKIKKAISELNKRG